MSALTGYNASAKYIEPYVILKIWSQKFGVSSFHFCSVYIDNVSPYGMSYICKIYRPCQPMQNVMHLQNISTMSAHTECNTSAKYIDPCQPMWDTIYLQNIPTHVSPCWIDPCQPMRDITHLQNISTMSAHAGYKASANISTHVSPCGI